MKISGIWMSLDSVLGLERTSLLSLKGRELIISAYPKIGSLPLRLRASLQEGEWSL